MRQCLTAVRRGGNKGREGKCGGEEGGEIEEEGKGKKGR